VNRPQVQLPMLVQCEHQSNCDEIHAGIVHVAALGPLTPEGTFSRQHSKTKTQGRGPGRAVWKMSKRDITVANDEIEQMKVTNAYFLPNICIS
jgi:hypothetical protein